MASNARYWLAAVVAAFLAAFIVSGFGGGIYLIYDATFYEVDREDPKNDWLRVRIAPASANTTEIPRLIGWRLDDERINIFVEFDLPQEATGDRIVLEHIRVRSGERELLNRERATGTAETYRHWETTSSGVKEKTYAAVRIMLNSDEIDVRGIDELTVEFDLVESEQRLTVDRKFRLEKDFVLSLGR